MDALHYYRVPINHTDNFPSAIIPAVESRIGEVLFEKKTFVFAGVRAHIYECMQAGCRGCGCPLFTGHEIPQEVHDYLHRHVELCEGLVRSKFPK